MEYKSSTVFISSAVLYPSSSSEPRMQSNNSGNAADQMRDMNGVSRGNSVRRSALIVCDVSV